MGRAEAVITPSRGVYIDEGKMVKRFELYDILK